MDQTTKMAVHPPKLFNRDFSLLWFGQSVSSIGKQMFYIAVLFWVKHATDSATMVGLLQMMSSLPAIILGPIGGTVADRYSRRKIIIYSNLFLGLVVLSLSLGMFAVSNNTEMIIVWLFVVSFLISAVDAFFVPGISASIPDLVPKERIDSANSLSQFSFQIALFIGQGVGGTLYRILGASLLFLINALTYLFAGFSGTFINIPQKIPEKGVDFKEQLNEIKKDMIVGFRFIWRKTGLKRLVLLSAVQNFFAMPIIVLLPFYVEDTLKASVDWYGFLVVSYGIGSLVGYLLIGMIKIQGKTRRNLLLIFILVGSFGYALLGMVRTPSVAVVLTFLGGLVSGVMTISITTLLQIVTPGEVRGRVFGLLGTIAGSITPIAMGLTGVIADLVDQNIPMIYIACGVLMTVFASWIAANREFWEFIGTEKELDTSTVVEEQELAP